MSVAGPVVPDGEWFNELVTTRLSASMRNDVLFRKLSQRHQKDSAVDNLKDQMSATLVRLDAHRYDVDLDSLTGESAKTLRRVDASKFDIDIESSSSTHSGRIRVERTSPHPDTDSEIDTSDSELSENWSRVSEFSGDGTMEDATDAEMSTGGGGMMMEDSSVIISETDGGKKPKTRKGFFRLKSRMRRAKKQLAAAGGVIAEAGHKMMKAHHKHPPASEGVWMVNNPVYEFERDMFEFAMGAQLRKRDAWSHLRYNSLN